MKDSQARFEAEVCPVAKQIGAYGEMLRNTVDKDITEKG